jgi:hypothetical protein
MKTRHMLRHIRIPPPLPLPLPLRTTMKTTRLLVRSAWRNWCVLTYTQCRIRYKLLQAERASLVGGTTHSVCANRSIDRTSKLLAIARVGLRTPIAASHCVSHCVAHCLVSALCVRMLSTSSLLLPATCASFMFSGSHGFVLLSLPVRLSNMFVVLSPDDRA